MSNCPQEQRLSKTFATMFIIQKADKDHVSFYEIIERIVKTLPILQLSRCEFLLVPLSAPRWPFAFHSRTETVNRAKPRKTFSRGLLFFPSPQFSPPPPLPHRHFPLKRRSQCQG